MQFGPDEERDIYEERMPERPANEPTEPAGEPWEDDDALASRLPRLWEASRGGRTSPDR